MSNITEKNLISSHLFFVALCVCCFIGETYAAMIDTDENSAIIPITNKKIEILGLYNHSRKKPLTRFTNPVIKGLDKPLQHLARMTSGARVSLYTNSKKLGIIAKVPTRETPSSIPQALHQGVDVYINGFFYNTLLPDSDLKFSRILQLQNKPKWKEIELYLPSYSQIDISSILLSKSSSLKKNKHKFSKSLPIIFYGSSITQGASSSNPGNTFPALVARKLNVDFYNFGFSGKGMGQKCVISEIKNILASAFILDFWANPPVEHYKLTLPEIVAQIRSVQPTVPIIITSPIYTPNLTTENEAKFTIGKKFVETTAKSDKNVYFIDLMDIGSKDMGHILVDARHPNSLGHYLIATKIISNLQPILFSNPCSKDNLDQQIEPGCFADRFLTRLTKMKKCFEYKIEKFFRIVAKQS